MITQTDALVKLMESLRNVIPSHPVRTCQICGIKSDVGMCPDCLPGHLAIWDRFSAAMADAEQSHIALVQEIVGRYHREREEHYRKRLTKRVMDVVSNGGDGDE